MLPCAALADSQTKARSALNIGRKKDDATKKLVGVSPTDAWLPPVAQICMMKLTIYGRMALC